MDKSFSGTNIFEYEDGRIYKGDFFNGIPHGKGQMTFPNLDIYEGDWLNGQMNGHGEYRRYNKSKDKYEESYVGEFVEGVMQGQGRIRFENHMEYEGQWQNGKRSGVGTLWISPGVYIHGIWKFDKIIRGVQHFENGDWYEGTFRNNKIHGFGRYYHSNGVFFDGVFEDGKPVKGIAVYPNGNVTIIDKE